MSVVPAGAAAYVWNGTNSSALGSDDPRRTFNNHCLYLAVCAPWLLVSKFPGVIEGTPTPAGHEPLQPSFFLIPA